MQFNNIYRNKKILVTGSSGFKGTWLVIWLTFLGARVYGVSFDEKGFTSHLMQNDKKFKNYKIDINNYKKIENLIREIKPQIIFHLAAQPLVLKSYKKPIDTWSTNLFGTNNLLEICRNVNFLKSIIIITSDKCYKDTKNKTKYMEDDTLGGHDPYSASKAATEILVESYRQSFFVNKYSPNLVTARAGNVIGGGDWGENRIIPDIIRSYISNKTLEIRNPEAVRPWQHVLDCLSGYLSLGQHTLSNDTIFHYSYNFGPGLKDRKSVKQLYNKLEKNFFQLKYKINKNNHKKKESDYLFLDSSRAKKYLKWKPILNFDETIKFTSDWYAAYCKNKSIIYKYQLNQYFEFAKRRKAFWIK
mgnify:CR=1 FL=1